MTICEFCLQLQKDGQCSIGLKLPRNMNCREFDPGIERFCANPSDFVNAHQLVQMSTFFGIKGAELRKIKLIAAQEEESRSEALRIEAYSLTARETEESNLWSAKNSRVGNENQREVDRESQ